MADDGEAVERLVALGAPELGDLLDVVEQSGASDWNVISHRAPGGRHVQSVPDAGFAWSAAFRPSVSLAIRWDPAMSVDLEDIEDGPAWVEQFDHDRWAYAQWTDVLWAGEVVHREWALAVEDGLLPCPYGALDGTGSEPIVTPFQLALVNLLCDLSALPHAEGQLELLGIRLSGR